MTIRTFIAVDIGAKPELVELESALDTLGADLKMVKPENIHVTLKFLGETDEGLVDDIKNTIRECTQGIAPFDLALKGAGVFPNFNYIKVLWIGLVNYEPLVTMAQKLDTEMTKFGFAAEKRAFKPHVTLARVKTRKKKNEIKGLMLKYQDTSFGDFPVNSVTFKQSVLDSTGPTYYRLAEITLE